MKHRSARPTGIDQWAIWRQYRLHGLPLGECRLKEMMRSMTAASIYKFFNKLLLTLTAFTVMMFSSEASGATIEQLRDHPASDEEVRPSTGGYLGPPCTHRLTGQIELGDASRLLGELRTSLQQIYGNEIGSYYPAALCLDSPGGSLVDAVDFVQGMFELEYGGLQGIATRIESDSVCVSSCALIFMAGSSSGWEWPWSLQRVIEPGARLGFHAPALDIGAGNYSETEVLKAYNIALAAVAELVGTLQSAHGGVVERMFPPALLLEWLSTPSEKMRYLENVDDAALWNIKIALPFNGYLYISAADMGKVCLRSMAWAQGRSAVNGYVDEFGEVSSTEDHAPGATIRDGILIVLHSPYGNDVQLGSQTICEFYLHNFEGSQSGDVPDTSSAHFEIGFEQPRPKNRLYADMEPGHSYRLFPPSTPIDAFSFPERLNGLRLTNAADDSPQSKPTRSANDYTCWYESEYVEVTNVHEFVNLRAAAGLNSPVIDKLYLGEKVRLEETDTIYRTDNTGYSKSCFDMCVAYFSGTANPGMQRPLGKCINENSLWAKVRSPRGALGFVSLKFLSETN